MSKKVVTLGEILLRLSTPDKKRFIQSESFDAIYGGAEANVAVTLANFGLNSYFVTKLPDNPLGDSAVNYIRRYGVKTDHIARGGKRVGIYFLEKGTSVRPSKVVYDRAASSITDINIDDVDFIEMFKDAKWFHFSGITPALGEKCIRFVQKAVEVAKALQIPISVDLNYRKGLWSKEEFEKVMIPLIQGVDVCIGWLSSVEEVSTTGIEDFANKDLDRERFIKIFSKMREKFNIKYVATTLRENYSASKNGLSAIIYDGNELYESKKYTFDIEDRVGGGDAFASGLIYKLIKGGDCREALELGVAASVYKHTISGDFNLATEEEINELLNGNSSGSVQR